MLVMPLSMSPFLSSNHTHTEIFHISVNRKINQTTDYENLTNFGPSYPMDVLSVHQRSQLPLPSKKRILQTPIERRNKENYKTLNHEK